MGWEVSVSFSGFRQGASCFRGATCYPPHKRANYRLWLLRVLWTAAASKGSRKGSKGRRTRSAPANIPSHRYTAFHGAAKHQLTPTAQLLRIGIPTRSLRWEVSPHRTQRPEMGADRYCSDV